MQHSIKNIIQLNNISFAIFTYVIKILHTSLILHLNQVKPSYVGSENLEKKHVKGTIRIIVFTGDAQKGLMCSRFCVKDLTYFTFVEAVKIVVQIKVVKTSTNHVHCMMWNTSQATLKQRNEIFETIF